MNNRSDIEALKRILPEDRIAFVPPGIFPEDFQKDERGGKRVRRRFGIDPDTTLILTAAMLRPGAKAESLAYLLTSLSLLHRKRNDFKLLVVGGGTLRAEFEKMAEELFPGKPGKAIFADTVPRQQMHRYYSAADIFAFPGIRESIGMVYLEAQSCGLPVVAINAGGAGPDGSKRQHGHARSAGRRERNGRWRFGKLLDDPILRKTLGEKGREYIIQERNLWKNYRIILKEFEESVSPTGPPIFCLSR